MELLLMGRVHNEQQVMQAFSRAPDIFRRTLLAWLWRETAMFIGTRKEDGVFRKELKKKRRWIDNRMWETKIIRLFSGKVVDYITKKTINLAAFSKPGNILGTGVTGRGFSMVAQMGLIYRNKKQIHEAMEFLETGGTISSKKYMPIPVKGAAIDKAGGKFLHWLRMGQFDVVYKNGLALYFLKNKLMYVGKRMVKVMFAHRFTQLASIQKPGVEIRAMQTVAKATDAAQRAGG